MKHVAIFLSVILLSMGVTERAEAHPEVDRWRRTAFSAGWQPYHWPMLSCIIWRETGGNPNAYNPEKQAGTPRGWGSYGLTQIYGKANWYWLKRLVQGDLRKLYNPYVNLLAAKKLYDMKGWQPWGGCRR